jgi:hypothetical protein
MRLAERVGPGSWTLAPGWQAELRELGTRGDILKQLQRAIPDDRVLHRIVRDGAAIEGGGGKGGAMLLGRVASKGLSDEAKGTFYAVLETPTGEAFHVPLDRRAAQDLQAGDVVSFAMRPEAADRAVDRQIAEAARAGGGVCVVRSADRQPHPHTRRLRELERFGLVACVSPESWRVAPNLLEELQRRARDAPPRQRLLVRKQPALEQQVRHEGPTWLDRVVPGSLAGFGFGREVRDLFNARREALRRMGVDPDDMRREEKLRELERRAVATQIATRTGQVLVASVGSGFRGRVAIADTHAPGSGYVVVSDGARFALLRATSPLRAAVGSLMTISRDGQGRLMVRAAPGKDVG